MQNECRTLRREIDSLKHEIGCMQPTPILLCDRLYKLADKCQRIAFACESMLKAIERIDASMATFIERSRR